MARSIAVAICLLAAGALHALTLAPFHWWWLALPSLAVLMLSLHSASPKQAFIRGWLYGAGMFLAGVSWIGVSITQHGQSSFIVAVVLTLSFCILMGLLIAAQAWIWRRFWRHSAYPALSFAALWVLQEALRGWMLTGFPWLLLGHAHTDGPLAGWAPIIGTAGITAIVAGSAALLYRALVQHKSKTLLPAGLLALSLFSSGPVLNRIEWSQPDGDIETRISMVQVNIPQALKWLPESFWPTLMLYQDLSEPLWEKSDLVIWPEAALPSLYQYMPEFTDRMSNAASEHDTALITGVLYENETGTEVYNSAIALGSGSGIYFKQRLVPFGEYVPLERYLRGLIGFFDLPTSHISPGPAQTELIQAHQLSLATYICYEIVYGDRVAKASRRANALLTISNDAWFGRSIGPHQHFQIARMRALETARPLIRATGTGISALVDHKGQSIVQLPQHRRAVLNGRIQGRRGDTPYARIGSTPVWLFSAAALLISLLSAGQIGRTNRR